MDMCPLVLQKFVLSVPLLHGGELGTTDARELSLLEGATKQMLLWGHNLRLLDEAEEPRDQQHLGPENQNS